MNRAAATTYLTTEFAELATYAQFDAGQIATAYSTATDMALRQLGYTEDVLATTDVPQVQVLPYLSLLTYHALRRFARLLSVQFTVMLPGRVQAMRNQAFAQVKELLAQAQADLEALGVDLSGVRTFTYGRVNLDFQEPSVVGEFSAQWWSDAYGGW